MKVAKSDTFLTLDEDFPLNMATPKDEAGQLRKDYEYKKKKTDVPCLGGVMAIKYMVTGFGKSVMFLDCGVILKGSASEICSDTQKRIILALLSRFVSSDFYSSCLNPAVGGWSSSSSVQLSRSVSPFVVEEIL